MRRQKPSQKKTHQRRHSKERALERYGLELTTRDLKEMTRLIQTEPKKDAVHIVSPTRRISIWKVVFKNTEIPVAYDRKSKTIASVLPPRALERYHTNPNQK